MTWAVRLLRRLWLLAMTGGGVAVPFAGRAWYTRCMQILAYLRAFFCESWREYVLVFVCALGVYAWLAPHGGFPDPDSFYHAKIGSLMLEGGVVRSLPQLPFTTLADAFADHHFLYHVLLVPFVAAFGALQGAAVAAIVLAAGAVTAVHYALRSYEVRFASVFTLIAASSAGFAFRMGLAKASSLAVILFMLSLVAFRRGNALALFLLGFVHVWSHGSWPVLWVMGGVFIAGRAFMALVEQRLGVGGDSAMKTVMHSMELRCAVAVFFGTIAGVLINPYFPQNIGFFKEQIVQIAVVGHAEGVGMGLEWYPYGPGEMLFETGPLALVIALLIAFFAALMLLDGIRRPDQALPHERAVIDVLATFVLALAFLVLAARSRRHVEYLVPFAALASGVAFTQLLSWTNLAALHTYVRDVFPRPRNVPALLAAYVIVALFALSGRSLHGVARVAQEAIVPWTKYAGAIAVLRAEAPSGAVVVSSDWDDFPPLFYGAGHVRSIVGLDPMFLYRKDSPDYFAWRAIATGKDAEIGVHAKETFGAAYVLVEKDHVAMRENAMRDTSLLLIHEDDDAALYSVR